MAEGITVINEKVKKGSGFVELLKTEIGKVIVGQSYLVERLLVVQEELLMVLLISLAIL